MKESEEKIAYCGLYCGDCFSHQGRIADLARDLRKELRAAKFDKAAPGFSKYFRDFTDYETCYRVLGAMVRLRCGRACRGGGGNPLCKIRNCCLKNEFIGCWECQDFESCTKLDFLVPIHADAHIKNLRKLKKQGTKGFLTGKRYW